MLPRSIYKSREGAWHNVAVSERGRSSIQVESGAVTHAVRDLLYGAEKGQSNNLMFVESRVCRE